MIEMPHTKETIFWQLSLYYQVSPKQMVRTTAEP